MEFIVDNAGVLTILAVAGLAAGLLAGLFGVGGGLVVVPVVFFVLQAINVDPALAMSIAVSTSLVAIVPTAISSTRAHHKLDNVDWLLVKRLAPALLVGVLVGSQLIAHLRSEGFIVFFGLFLFLMALNIILRGNRQSYLPHMPALWVQSLFAFGVGGVSAVAGVGGGAVGVPLLTAANMSLHRAIGSCAAFGLCVALMGTASIVLTAATPAEAPPGTWHLVYLPALCALTPLTILMAPRGAALGKRLSPSVLRKLFAGILIIIAGQMLYSVWG